MKAPVQFTIVPAQPGFWLVFVCDGGECFVGNPIIAWKIGGEPEDVWPITDEEIVEEGHQAWAIQRPDGTICEPLCATFKNLEEFTESLKVRHTEALERKKARAEADALKALAIQSA